MNTEKSSKRFDPEISSSFLPAAGRRMETKSSTCGWTTSHDLDRAMARNSEVSSAYLEKLDKDRDRRSEVKYKSLQNIPVSIRQMINPSHCTEGVTVRRWVALPKVSPRQVKWNDPSHHDNRRGASQTTHRTDHHSGLSEATPRGRCGLLKTSPRDRSDSEELFGVTSVPFKCPSLSSSRKKNCCIPSRLDSQITLRKAMRSQIEQQRNSALTKHVQFLNSNKLSGTRLTPPSSQLRPRLSYGSPLTNRNMTDVNIELLAILTVQEHNVPIIADGED